MNEAQMKAYKYRIYPNGEQKVLIEKHFGCARFTYNWALALQQKYYDEHKKSLSRKDIQDQLVSMKKQEQYSKAYEIEMDKSIELQKRVDAAFRVLSQLNALDDEAHKRWKREACLFSQGESNAYEHAVRLLGQALKGEHA